MPDPDFLVRTPSTDDVDIIAHHRAEMFRDIHGLDDAQCASMFAESRSALGALISAGEYLGWFASPASEPARVVGGVGIRLRGALPSAHERDGPAKVVLGRQGLIVNVYVEREWRRLGIAALLMRRLLADVESLDLMSVVLHASPDGRALYRSLGFAATNEMRYTRPVDPIA
jgi:ribosomal protein S18 acetylase RimI-like enzyme